MTEEIEMWLYPNIGLAQMDEGGDKENRVRVQNANPDLIVKDKTMEKRMNGNPKSPFEVILKYCDLTGAGVGVTLSLWLLRDFFHSLTIISALFFESLFAIDVAGRALNWVLRMLKMAKAGGCYATAG